MTKVTMNLNKVMHKIQKEVDKIAEKETIKLNCEEERKVNSMMILKSLEEEVLKGILDKYDGNENLHVNVDFGKFSPPIQGSINRIMPVLIGSGYIAENDFFLRGSNTYLTPEGISYFCDKEKFLTKQKEKEELMIKQASNTQIVVGDIHAAGGNVVIGDVIDSTLTIDNSITKIENLINEKGGEDKEELKQLLEEAKEIIEEIEETRRVPKRKGFFDKLSNHLEKHGWFYGSVIGVLGQATLMLIGG